MALQYKDARSSIHIRTFSVIGDLSAAVRLAIHGGRRIFLCFDWKATYNLKIRKVPAMDINKNDLNSLPLNALNEIPTPRDDAKDIVALVKRSGKVTGYKLSDGSMLDKNAAISLARQGGINGVGIANRKGNEYLKSLPDGAEENNLSNLPSITQ
jgi:hypothetical protein